MKCWRAMLVVATAAVCATAGAATYTCVGADGRKSFSDRPCPATTTDAARRDAGAGGYLSQRHGMTFGLGAAAGDTVSASCQALPAPQDRPRDGGCDAERGDTACSRALPVLCIKDPERRARTSAVVDANSGRLTPPPVGEGPQLGASPALRGDSLASQQSGTQACARALGGWLAHGQLSGQHGLDDSAASPRQPGPGRGPLLGGRRRCAGQLLERAAAARGGATGAG